MGIKIKVEGPRKSGKSLITRIIHEGLWNFGIRAEVEGEQAVNGLGGLKDEHPSNIERKISDQMKAKGYVKISETDTLDHWESKDGDWEGFQVDVEGVEPFDKIHYVPMVTLFGKHFHVEAYRVRRGEGGYQEAANEYYNDEFAWLCNAHDPDGGFQTIEIDGMTFVPFVFPHSE